MLDRTIRYTIEASTELLIGQWQDAVNLRAITQIFLDVMQEQIVDPVNTLQRMREIDTGEGVWLDYIGRRLGIIRPWIALSRDNDPRFGFDSSGVGFEQGRFSNAQAQLEPRTPIGDVLFRRFLRARVRTIRYQGDYLGYTLALREIDPEAQVTDNHDMTVVITTTRQADVEIGERIEAIALPAGVGRTFA